jgi:hypothetical protein
VHPAIQILALVSVIRHFAKELAESALLSAEIKN